MKIRIFFPCLLYTWNCFCVAGEQFQLEKIALYGNIRTKNGVILRELHVRKGKSFTDADLNKDRSWLLRLDFLKRIEFQRKPGHTSNNQMVMLIVQEEDPWFFTPILETSHPFGWIGGLKWTVPNFRGRREKIQLLMELGGINRGLFFWSNPWFGGKLRLFTSICLQQRIFKYTYHDMDTAFHEKETSCSWTIGRNFGRIFQSGFRSHYQQFWTDFPSIMISSNSTDNLLSTELFTEVDTRDWPLYPKTGLYLQSWMRWVYHDRNALFRRTGIECRGYVPIFRDNILAAQFAGQWSDGTVPVYQRIHLGGGETIRGYSKGSLAGENSLMASIEYRFPIFYERNPLAGIHIGYTGVLFLDTGMAWYQNEKPRWNKLHGSAGLGIHFILDHWVIRGEYGHQGKGWGFINTGTSVKF
jgi:outer membrane protein insertion porin family